MWVGSALVWNLKNNKITFLKALHTLKIFIKLSYGYIKKVLNCESNEKTNEFESMR